MKHIKTETGFAHGDFAKIQRKAQAVLKGMDSDKWEVSHFVTRYHAKRHTKPCSTEIGMVVREVTRNFLKEKAEKVRKIAELAA